MSLFDKMNKTNGGYIFLSHSHNDISRVREIRNALEVNGFEPLCFYLKCLDEESEIEDLIKREIDAREWFVFVNSENSRKSKWVNLERDYITKTNKKKIITVDIDDERSVREAIQKITHNLRIFISYSRKDVDLAGRIIKKLRDKDYLVFFDRDSISPGDNYIEITSNAISDASKNGCVIALISPDFMKSGFTKRELCIAMDQGGNIIPVTIGGVKLDREMEYYLSDIRCYNLSEEPSDEEIDLLIEKIGRAII